MFYRNYRNSDISNTPVLDIELSICLMCIESFLASSPDMSVLFMLMILNGEIFDVYIVYYRNRICLISRLLVSYRIQLSFDSHH